jgi:hypothetical protein
MEKYSQEADVVPTTSLDIFSRECNRRKGNCEGVAE